MDDRTWIREDTLTMQLAIPLDLGIYNRHIYNDDEFDQSNLTRYINSCDNSNFKLDTSTSYY